MARHVGDEQGDQVGWDVLEEGALGVHLGRHLRIGHHVAAASSSFQNLLGGDERAKGLFVGPGEILGCQLMDGGGHDERYAVVMGSQSNRIHSPVEKEK